MVDRLAYEMRNGVTVGRRGLNGKPCLCSAAMEMFLPCPVIRTIPNTPSQQLFTVF